MIEDDFYATLKLKSGEELFARVSATDEGDRTLLLVSHPIMVEQIKLRGSIGGYKFEPWLKSTQDDLFIINLDDVLTMSESDNVEMVMFYQDYIKKANQKSHTKLDQTMGYLTTVKAAKEALEKLYKSNSNQP